jgi:3-deoxy-D-manno-octulosonic-acid transferase
MRSPTGNRERAVAPEGLPLTLAVYRLLTTVASPFAPALISHRLKHGKEDPERVRERYGESKIARPAGPLIWIHCASVGEMLAVIPLIERIRDKEFNVLCTGYDPSVRHARRRPFHPTFLRSLAA